MKSKKIAILKFSKRELSNVNSDTIRNKSFEFHFDEEQYNKWFNRNELWDEWVSQNVEKKKIKMEKRIIKEVISSDD